MNQITPDGVPLRLRVSRHEADRRIRRQIKKAHPFVLAAVKPPADFEQIETAFFQWCEENSLVLDQLFEGPVAAQRYRRLASAGGPAVMYSDEDDLAIQLKGFSAVVRANLNALKFILENVRELPELRGVDMNPIEANARRLLALMVEGRQENYKPEWLAGQTGLTPQEIRDACELLAEWGAVKIGDTLAPPYGIHTVWVLAKGRFLYHEWQGEKEKEEMARKPAAGRSPSRLRVTRDEAGRQIRPQIRKGRQLLEAEITNDSQLEQARASFLDWRGYNLEVLTQLFEGGAIVEEFEQAATFRGPVFMVTDHDPFPDAVHRDRELIRGGVNALEAILNRLKTIPEPEQAGESLASLVRGSSMDDRHEPHITRLRVSRTEAEQKIRQSIEQGRQIRSTPMTTQEEAVIAHRELQKWHSINADLLRYLSSTGDLAHGLGRPPLNNSATGNRFSATLSTRRHLTNVDEELNHLETVLESLPYYDEPSQASQVQSELPATQNATRKEPCVFIGHGRSLVWARLDLEFARKWKVKTIPYEAESRAGQHIVDILKRMLDEATFAALVLTAEDQTGEDTVRARQNVVHEVGLFQGRLGFEKVVLLLQRGVEEFSNLAGLQVLYFERDQIQTTFYDLEDAMKREKVLT